MDLAKNTVAEIMGILDLARLKRDWKIIGCIGTTGEGVLEGFDWLAS